MVGKVECFQPYLPLFLVKKVFQSIQLFKGLNSGSYKAMMNIKLCTTIKY